jgi:hypothetical protein
MSENVMEMTTGARGEPRAHMAIPLELFSRVMSCVKDLREAWDLDLDDDWTRTLVELEEDLRDSARSVSL